MSMSGGSFISTSTAQLEPEETIESLGRDCSSEEGGLKTAVGRMRVDLALSSREVRVVFDPGAVEKARILEQLNQVAMLGYRPPRSSTK